MGFETLPKTDWEKLKKINLVEGLIKTGNEEEAKKILAEEEEYVTGTTEIEHDIKDEIIKKILNYKNILGADESDMSVAKNEIFETQELIKEVLRQLSYNKKNIEGMIMSLEGKLEKLQNIGKK